MKELTIEEKAKRYDETIERARKLYNSEETSSEVMITCEKLFSELTESEDEKIKKEIIKFVQFYYGASLAYKHTISKDDMIGWLEKQGKKESDPRYEGLEDLLVADDIYQMAMNDAMVADAKNKAINALQELSVSKILGLKKLETAKEERIDNQNCVKTTNKVEPKFKVGDWITNGDYTWKIIEVKPLDYILQAQDGNIIDDTISYVDKQFHYFTSKDVKDGDVLVDKDDNIGIFQECLGLCWHSYIYLGSDGQLYGLGIGGSHEQINTNACPATKEQRDLLFKKIKESGYEWDAKNKKLNKIEPKFKVGDWITNGLANPEQIISIEDDMYYAHSSIDDDLEIGGDIESIDKEYHLWTIEDAKDGDVLISQYNDPFIYKGHCDGLVDSYGGILCGEFDIADKWCSWTINEDIHPATQEQRDLLFQKMKEAGYEFDFENKELKKANK